MAEKQRDAQTQDIIDLIKGFYEEDEYTEGSKAWFKRKIKELEEKGEKGKELADIRSKLESKEKKVMEAIETINKNKESKAIIDLATAKAIDRNIKKKEKERKKIQNDLKIFRKFEQFFLDEQEYIKSVEDTGLDVDKDNTIEAMLFELVKNNTMLKWIEKIDDINGMIDGLKLKNDPKYKVFCGKKNEAMKDKEKIENEIKGLNQDISNKNKEIEEQLAKKISTREGAKEYNSKEQELEDLNKKLENAEARLSKKNEELNSIDNEIAKIKEKIESKKNKLKQDKKVLESKIKQVNQKQQIPDKDELKSNCRDLKKKLKIHIGKKGKEINDNEIDVLLEYLCENSTIPVTIKKGKTESKEERWAAAIFGKDETDSNAPYYRVITKMQTKIKEEKFKKDIQYSIDAFKRVFPKSTDIPKEFEPQSEELKEIMGITKGIQSGNEEKTAESNPTQSGNEGKTAESNPTQSGNEGKTAESNPTQSGNEGKTVESNLTQSANEEKTAESNPTQSSNEEKTVESNPTQSGNETKVETIDIKQDEEIRKSAEELARLVKAKTAVDKKLKWWQFFKKLARIPVKRKLKVEKTLAILGRFKKTLEEKAGIDAKNISNEVLENCAKNIENGVWKLEIPIVVDKRNSTQNSQEQTAEQGNPHQERTKENPTTEQGDSQKDTNKSNPTTEQGDSQEDTNKSNQTTEQKNYSQKNFEYNPCLGALVEARIAISNGNSGKKTAGSKGRETKDGSEGEINK